MTTFLAFTVFGLFSGAAYAIAASGLVLTYTTTRVFNIAHGALGMVMSFVFWDFSVRQGLPTWLALVLVLLVVAPATGWLLQRFVTRGLGEGPVSVALVVTVGLLVGCIGFATQIWPPEARSVLPFFPTTSFEVGGVIITGHQLLTIVLSAATALGLYLLLNRTRIGTAMRASVDNPELLRLFGGKPDTAAALSWAIGVALAALAGVLLVSQVGLDYYALTLLVINAYAAAMLGRLKSLPMTFAGAMALGLATSYASGYLPTDGLLNSVRNVIPALFLFLVIVLMPQAQLRIGQVKGIVSAPLPSMTKSVGWGAALLLVVALLAGSFADSDLLLVGTAATYAMVMLSLVLLTGYGGHVSLAQLTFAGVGALAYAKLDEPNLYGLALSALIAAGVGALVALPVLRLTGLYLALSTMAFAYLMDKMVFQAEFAFGFNGTLPAERMSVLGTSITSTGGYVMLMAVFFVLTALALLLLRRGPVGRLLIAMRDSPAACGTLGLDLRWFRVALFGLSAGMAGLAGALYAGLRQTIGAADFQFFNSLPLLLLAVVFGVTSVTGATLGGIGLMLLPVMQSDHPGIAGLIFAVIGFGAVAAGRDPNGLANQLFRVGRLAETRLLPQVRERLPRLPERGEVDAPAEAVVPGLADQRPDSRPDSRKVPAHVAP
ncbi:ABC transporter permease [Nocardioides lianchengensis]|uniref:Branched-chain amino acid transport system permease protein n=1 Tax=Nocardioides lianchengensis TaxID=1045774 RepID=A0A1G7AQ40_9ACTN|nr:ABC transporter permease [Nocardioides lianchengensis]NYG13249.1 branched-chain amino acid transport system permease protein [Nocardioides lianchengensis]SDE16862.1 branched-chain amino acid transport system permease protein [Nocardioides lianchengensis]